MKKSLPFIVVACLLMTICFIPSSEADGESLWVNNVDAVNNPGSLPAGCTFDAVNNILTLNDVGNLTSTKSVSSGMGTQTGVIVDNRGVGLTLNIIGDDNRLTNSGAGDDHSIYVTGNLTMTGSGELTATTSGDTSIMIGGSLTFNGPSVTATCGSSAAIFGNNGLSMSAGYVSGSMDSNNGLSISGSSDISSSVIMVTEGAISISGTATVNVTGNFSLLSEGTGMTITGSPAITVGSMFNIGGGDVSISGSPTIDINQFMCEDGLTISGTPTIEVAQYIIVNSDPSDGLSTMLIEGGTITVAAGGMIDSDGNITMTGGNVIFEGELNSDPAFIANGGPTFDGVVELTGGSITATNATTGKVLVSGMDNDPPGDVVLTYVGANPLNKLSLVGNTLVVSSDGVASISFPVAGYTVSFNANGGTGTMSSTTKNGSYALPENGFTAPTGKEFKCWSVTIGSAAAVEKNPGQTVNVTADTTVKAIWQDVPVTKYTVSFDANGGTGTMASVTDVSGEYTLPECTFTAPEGKTFKCWSIGDTEKNAGDKITVSADTTVKAVWKDSPSPSSGGGEFPMGAVIGAVIGGIAVIGIAVFVLKKMGKF